MNFDFEESYQESSCLAISRQAKDFGSTSSTTDELFNHPDRTKRLQEDAAVDDLSSALSELSLDRAHWDTMAVWVKSDDPHLRMEGCKNFRILLSVAGKIPIDEVVSTGVIPVLVNFLHPRWPKQLRFEAAWALSNVSSGTNEHAEVVVRAGGVSGFFCLLDSCDEDLVTQGLWGLGNIAGDRQEFRDIIIDYQPSKYSYQFDGQSITSCGWDSGVMKVLEGALRCTSVSAVKTAVWCVTNLARGKPKPSFSKISPIVLYLKEIVRSQEPDLDILSDAIWALDGIASEPLGHQAVASSDLLSWIVKGLQVPLEQDENVRRLSLRILGQIATGGSSETAAILATPGCLSEVINLATTSPKTSLRKDSLWLLSNIAAGPPEHITILLQHGLDSAMVFVFNNHIDNGVRTEAAWTVANLMTTTNCEQLGQLIRSGCLGVMSEIFTLKNAKLLSLAVNALNSFLKVGMKHARSGDQNECAIVFRQAGGVNRLLMFLEECKYSLKNENERNTSSYSRRESGGQGVRMADLMLPVEALLWQHFESDICRHAKVQITF